MFEMFKKELTKFFNDKLAKEKTLFTVNIDKDVVWNMYLDSFDSFRRQEFNCTSCRHFLKNYAGFVVVNNDYTITSLWDLPLDRINVKFHPFIKNVKQYVHSLPISSLFCSTFAKLGTDKNYDTVKCVYWNHFFVTLPQQFIVVNNDEISKYNENVTLLQRSFSVITVEACETVLDLIDSNTLYRGAEFKEFIVKFCSLLKQYNKSSQKDNFCWKKCYLIPESVCRIKNSAIGTLLVALSEGEPLEHAVGAFERIVAPTNYKRPTSLVTTAMVERAKETLASAGYLDALDRRYATYQDLNVNNILFVDKSSNLIDVFDTVKNEVLVDPKKFKACPQVPIAHFLGEIVPNAQQIKILPEITHLNNFITLLTGANLEAKNIFKWNNPFSWYYTNGVTDSIKERVKKAGGNINGVLRVSLSWSNYDDLDLHVTEPSGSHIFYATPRNYNTSGHLDVDMNAGSGRTRTPVENITWSSPTKMEKGVYKVHVHNYHMREHIDIGFTIEIECNGQVYNFNYSKSPMHQKNMPIASFTFDGTNITFAGGVATKISSTNKWGVATNTFTKVKSVMLSPNHWGNNTTGNKHYIFTLENCVCDELARGIFNEFLTDELLQHRKVLEVIGSKLQISPSEYQVSGLGFSETQQNRIFAQVKLHNNKVQNCEVVF